MITKANNKNRIMRIITVPIKVLCKARDRYVKSINGFADRGRYGNMGGPAAMPRSFSVNNTNSLRSNESEDERQLRVLIRALSTRSSTTSNPINTNNSMDHLYMMQQQQMRKSKAMASRRMPRSCSVGMGKIDEDEPFDFGEDSVVSVKVKPESLYPRSRSYAVGKRNIAF